MKRTKTQKGITLIALIITIVVLLILAVVAIRAVQNTGIITHAKNASSETTIAQEKEQITLSLNGWKIEKNLPGNTQTFAEYMQGKIEGATITDNGDGTVTVSFEKTRNAYIVAEDGTIEEVEPPYLGLIVDATTEGVTYLRDSVEITDLATVGEPQLGDSVTYNGYEYRYNQYWYAGSNKWLNKEEQNGWGARYTGTSVNPGELSGMIFGKSLVSIREAFYYKSSVETAPKIPSTVIDMSACFSCTNLKSAPDIPNKVTNLAAAFSECTNLSKVGKIGNSVTNMQHAFYNSSIEEVPNIPNSVQNLQGTFWGTKIKKLDNVEIPKTCESLPFTFSDCKELVDASGLIINENVKYLPGIFCNCINLEKAPKLPNNITNLGSTGGYWYRAGAFQNCYKLSGNIEINADASKFEYCFFNAGRDTENGIRLIGTSTKLQEYANTATSTYYLPQEGNETPSEVVGTGKVTVGTESE